MDWDTALAAEAGELGHSAPGQIRQRMQRLIDTRKRLDSLHAGVATQVRSGRGLGVAIFDRKHPAGNLIQLYNLSDGNRFVNTDELGGMWGEVVDELNGHTI